MLKFCHHFFPILVILAGFCSCRTVRVIEQVPVEVHDTVYQKMVQRDSIYIDYFFTTDTAYRYIERPVTVTRTETVEVKKPLRWWQKGLMLCGAIGILTVLAAVAVRLRRR